MNKKIVISIFILFILFSLPFAFIEYLYRSGLSLMTKPLPAFSGVSYPQKVREAFWIDFKERGPVKVVPMTDFEILKGFFRFALIARSAGSDLRSDVPPNSWPPGATITLYMSRSYMLGQRMRALDWERMNFGLVVWLTRHWTTEDILDEVAEKAYYGRGTFGFQNAAKVYFKKEPVTLTEYEVAQLVTIARRPELYSKDKTKLQERTKKLLEDMAAQSFVIKK